MQVRRDPDETLMKESRKLSLSAVEAFFFLLLPSEVGLGEGQKVPGSSHPGGVDKELRGSSRPGSGITCYSGLGRSSSGCRSSWCHRTEKLR